MANRSGGHPGADWLFHQPSVSKNMRYGMKRMTIKKLNRREFLGTSAVFACSAMLPAVVDAGEVVPSPSKSLPYLKEYQPGINSDSVHWVHHPILTRTLQLEVSR